MPCLNSRQNTRNNPENKRKAGLTAIHEMPWFPNGVHQYGLDSLSSCNQRDLQQI
jgi:predicted component of type VI protein secretion system